MSVLRAVLGRLARFLMRIARTLDPGVAATPYPAAAERMAVLRQRYPGAPDHWLELLARRTSLGGDGAERAASREEARPQSQQPRFAAPQPAARPAPRFPAPAAGTGRTVVRPAGAATTSRLAPEPPGPAARRLRPMLTFAAARARAPLANLLRREPPPSEPREGPRFDDSRSAPPHDPQVQPAGDRDARQPAPVFRDPVQHSAQHEWIGAAHQRGRPSDSAAAWPEFRFSVPPGPSWPADSSRGRPSLSFAAPDHRWPELPALLDELAGSGLRASDEAALLAEQIGGKWSA